MTDAVRSVSDYEAHVDPLHRNTWPIRVKGDDTVIGNLTEHITVELDGNTPPVVRWSWAFSDAEADALKVDSDLRASSGRYRSWRSALDVFVNMHQLAIALRTAEWNASRDRTPAGE